MKKVRIYTEKSEFYHFPLVQRLFNINKLSQHLFPAANPRLVSAPSEHNLLEHEVTTGGVPAHLHDFALNWCQDRRKLMITDHRKAKHGANYR